MATHYLNLKKYASLYSYLFRENPRSLQVDLAVISNEALEAYLEDLLDFTIRDVQLFIYRKNVNRIYVLFALAGITLAIALGFRLALSGNSFWEACYIVVLFTLPSIVLWQLAPKSAPNRRLFFAKLISQELDRRNGSGQDSFTLVHKLQLKKFVKDTSKTSPGVTKESLH